MTTTVPDIRLAGLGTEMEEACRQCAAVLVEAFRELAPTAWPDMAAATVEVTDALAIGKVNRIDGDESDDPLPAN